jgi:sugar phosphate isomerase/epimerase
MRPLGYSTGALARGDFRRALHLLSEYTTDAIELSALRSEELEPLIKALQTLDLKRFIYVSVHAPSQFSSDEEPEIVRSLCKAAARGCYIIVHPDAMHDVDAWAALGSRLCLENMDKRKATGRSADELSFFFKRLPRASLCFDIGHARQVDSSMTEAFRILKHFGNRICQVHISEVTTTSRHTRVSKSAVADYQRVAAMIPQHVPLIVEAQVSPGDLSQELDTARQALALPEPVAGIHDSPTVATANR